MGQQGASSDLASGDGELWQAPTSLGLVAATDDFTNGLNWQEQRLPKTSEEASRDREEKRDFRLRVPAARRDPVMPLALLRQARCGGQEAVDLEIDFFSDKPRDRDVAKLFCLACPIQRDCLTWALYTMQLWGVWGGIDENEIRRTLSVNAHGSWTRRSRPPRCPECHSLDIVKDGFIMRCAGEDCGLSWPRVPKPRQRRQITFMGDGSLSG
jgi:hypothetical protein